MGDAADYAREEEEEWEILKLLHNHGQCNYDCPFCEMENE